MYPLQRSYHVLQAVVARRFVLAGRFRGERWRREEAEHSHPVVDRDYHDALGREARAAVYGRRPRTGHERATRYRHEHRQSMVEVRGGSPDVEIQAILADPSLGEIFARPRSDGARSHDLPAAWREFRCG